MIPFLEELAQSIYKKHKDDFLNLYVVLPSRRSAVYFRMYLAKIVDGPIIAPNILSMDDFVKQLSKLYVPSQVELLLRLYDTYKKYDHEKANNLERFTPLGSTLLKDFSMIDKNLTEYAAIHVFEYLKDVKALERWGKELGRDIDASEHPSLLNYFAFWEHLEKTYADFRKSLLEDGFAYSGLAYRKVHENLEQLITENKIEHVVFAGFAQMTGAEEDIIRTCIKLKKATTYWDADNYYMKNTWHEAGDYIRNYQKKWLPKETVFANGLTQLPKEINLIESPDELSQARYTGKLIGDVIEDAIKNKGLEKLKKSVNQTAILLPDGSMLNPVLYSLPDYTSQGFTTANYLNLTMGTSLKNSQLADLILLLFKMQERALSGKSWKIYYLDLEHLLAHPFLLFEPTSKEIVQEILAFIRSQNIVYIEHSELLKLCSESRFLTLIFKAWEGNMFVAIEHLKAISEHLSEQLDSQKNSLEQELLFQFYTLLNNLYDAFKKRESENLRLNTFRYFLFELMKNHSVPFSGELVSPFQIMGMLESRTLDFKHVIILSCNEGHLPKSKVIDSVVPFGMRVHYKLPTHQENDGSFAYTFFRLFHRAEKITLIYKATQVGEGEGEPSRFIQQIENEWGNFSNIKINKLKLELPAPSFVEKEKVSIKKDKAVIQKIKEVLTKGRSPSAINAYIRSPLEFFYKHLLKLEDPENVEEYLDQRTFGTMLHDTLEEILTPYKSTGKPIDSDELASISKDDKLIRICLYRAVEKSLLKMDVDTGKNHLLKEAAIELIKRYFKNESEKEPYQIVDLEGYHGASITIPMSDWDTPTFKVAGKADRIDLRKKDGYYHLRIVDYKTGTYEKSKQLNASTLEQLFSNHEKEKIVQLMLYKYMIIREIQENKVENLPKDFSLERDIISAGFVFFRKLEDDFVEYNLKDIPTNNLAFIDYVEKFLVIFAKDLLDTNKAFTEDPSDFMPSIKLLEKEEV